MNIPTVIVRLDKPTGNDHRLVIRVENDRHNEEIESQTFSRDDLQQVVGKFRDTLKAICDIHENHSNKGQTVQFKNLCDTMEEIGIFNAYCKNVLGREQYKKIQESLFKLIPPGVKKEQILRREEPIGRIIYEGNIRDFIPLDFLLLDHSLKCNKVSKDFSHAMQCLPQITGFSFLVTRNPLGTEPFRIKTSKLEVHLYADKTLKSVDREIAFFKDNANVFNVSKLEEPRLYEKEEAARKLVQSLADSDSHFYHFGCHADTHSDDWEYHLPFGKNKIKLAQLQYFYDEMHSTQDNNLINQVLTFLNACGSAVVNPKDVLTFPKVFLEHFGQGGFIGTEYKVPTKFACEFAMVFYANLLKNGSLDIALFKTRWFFAKKYINPLGLFYTLYAAPDSGLSYTINSIQI